MTNICLKAITKLPIAFVIGFLLLTPFAGSAFASQQQTHTSSHVQKIHDYVLQQVDPETHRVNCGTGWNKALDPANDVQYFQYAYTTGSQKCSEAFWDDHGFTQNKTCDVNVYIPSILATANIAYAFYDGNNSVIRRQTYNQAAGSGWDHLVTNISGLHHVYISSNNGETNTYMAAGPMQFDCQ